MCARASAQGALLRPTERAAARAHGAHCNRTAPPRKTLRTLTAPHSYSRAAHPRAKRKLADLGQKTVTVAGQHSQHASDAEQTRAQKCRRRAPARAGGGWLATQVCVAIHHAQPEEPACTAARGARTAAPCMPRHPRAAWGNSPQTSADEGQGDNRNDEAGDGQCRVLRGQQETSRTLLLHRTRIYAAQLHPPSSTGASPDCITSAVVD